MAVDDIALGDEVGSPNGVEDLVAGDDAAGSARQKVEQALLDAAEMHDGIPGVHLAVNDVDVDLADRDPRYDRPARPGGPAGDHDAPGQKLLRRERRGKNVIDAKIEGFELGRQIPPTRQAQDRRHAAREGV